MKKKQYHKKNHGDFSQNTLATLFFAYVNALKSHNLNKEAEDLLKISGEYYLPENRNIIAKIITEMQTSSVSDEINKFQQYLRRLRN